MPEYDCVCGEPVNLGQIPSQSTWVMISSVMKCDIFDALETGRDEAAALYREAPR